ncbi:MAG: hypothetical protein KAH54_07525 [Candidatus Sabulitectum sp.]|nr:hypothetical protein [Candidatus Sabulitectum sp.]
MKKAVIPAVVFLVALLVPIALSLRSNDGNFVYTLDDPYIHLALSENIAQGHYGINDTEFTAPSSSVLWPFLLLPFTSLSSFYLAPLILNTIFALFTIFLLNRFYGPKGVFLTIASIYAFNIAGLVLTGMEHSLQLLFVVLIAVEISAFLENRKVSPWLAVSLVAAPLIRYECLAISLPVLAFLFVAGEKKKASMLLVFIVITLGAFSLFLVHLGLDPMPASVNAKSSVVSGSGSIGSILGNLVDSVRSFRGMVQLLVLIPFITVLFNSSRNRNDKLLAAAVTAAVVLHLVVGRSGWFHRYGVYIWVFSILMIFQLYRDLLIRFRVPAALLLLLLSADYLSGYTKIKYASGNIYQQQYQMRSFVHQWLGEPVAVNDLGLVSMGYDEYVLDLWGLATPAALQGAFNPVWVDSVARANGVNTAIVYRDEIPGVQHWTHVARMEIAPPLVVCVSGGVDFLSAPWSSADSLREKLYGFMETLPDGIEIVIF